MRALERFGRPLRLVSVVPLPPPPSADPLAVPPPDLVDRWNGPYLDGGLPIDPWGTAYQYQAGESLSRRGIVLSYGNDGEPGGEGLAADLYSRGNDPNAGLEPSAGARP